MPQEMKVGISLSIHSFIQQIFIAHLLCAKPCYQAVCSGNKIGIVPARGMCHLVMLRSTIFLCSGPAVGDEQGQTSRTILSSLSGYSRSTSQESWAKLYIQCIKRSSCLKEAY